MRCILIATGAVVVALAVEALVIAKLIFDFEKHVEIDERRLKR